MCSSIHTYELQNFRKACLFLRRIRSSIDPFSQTRRTQLVERGQDKPMELTVEPRSAVASCSNGGSQEIDCSQLSFTDPKGRNVADYRNLLDRRS